MFINMKNLIDNINFVSSELSSFIPISLPLSIMFFGVRKMKKIIYEDTIKDLDKRDLFTYLIEDRIFIESLSDENIKHYYKCFKLYHKNIIKKKIVNFFRFKR